MREGKKGDCRNEDTVRGMLRRERKYVKPFERRQERLLWGFVSHTTIWCALLWLTSL